VVRVEPSGDAVIAGRASPRAAVQLRSDGRVVAQVDADEAGQFAILPPPFSAGGHRLQLAARAGASEVLSDAIGIEVPGAAEAASSSPPAPQPSVPSPASAPAKSAAAPASEPVETARSEAPAPAKTAPPPEAPKAGPPEPAKVAALDPSPASRQLATVSILSVEASGTGRLEAKGAADPDAVVRLYLNNAYLADAIAGADGRWSLTVERGMTPGAYAIRADEIDRTNGAVIARAEVPFNYPERSMAGQIAAAPSMGTPAAAPEKAPAQQVQDQAAPSTPAAAAPAPQPRTAQAAPAASPSVANATPLPTHAAPTIASEAPQPATPTPTPPTAAATAPEPAKPGGTAAAANNSSAATDAAANPLPAPSSPPAAAEQPVAAAAEPAKPGDSAHPVVPDIRTTKVVRGDNLWNLSKHFYGYGPEYKIIYEANASQIRNPRLIYPDQIFVVPRNPPQ
jgi:nucleoid-associated protein YgaU